MPSEDKFKRGRLIENVKGKGTIRKIDDHGVTMPYMAFKEGNTVAAYFITLTAARAHIGHDTKSRKVSA